MINSNDYKRGYQDGYNDALTGVDRDYRRSGASLKFAVFGSSAIDSYNEGYNEGYRIGMRDSMSR